MYIYHIYAESACEIENARGEYIQYYVLFHKNHRHIVNAGHGSAQANVVLSRRRLGIVHACTYRYPCYSYTSRRVVMNRNYYYTVVVTLVSLTHNV